KTGSMNASSWKTNYRGKLKEIIPTIILGACNPNLAYEAYTANSDVACLLPCNAVIREIKPGVISLEFAKATSMMTILGENNLVILVYRPINYET
ncbi:MAG: DUF302 domain-containing protein, partial [Gallionella sp.]